MTGNIIAQKIQEDLKTAVRAQDKPRVSALRMVLNALKNAELEEREELSDEKELAVIASYARKIKESIEEFRKAAREDLVAKESAELVIVLSYLPEQMSDEEIRREAARVIADVGAATPRDMGRVMGEMMKRFKGKVDGAAVNRVVSELLGRA
ncbi:MAG: GatB/YqeY domain-containing protein [Candidatus Krumholzibacteria bacterium]|nr:GatB/YqeY domain-containing protein [Candidatus Krumholzibacteria bacterium]